MKNKTTSLLLSLLIALWVPLLHAKGDPSSQGGNASHRADKPGEFSGKGEGSAHSNAPSTSTQMKGEERAMEVGQGKKKGLYKKQPGEELPPEPVTTPPTAPQTEPR